MRGRVVSAKEGLIDMQGKAWPIMHKLQTTVQQHRCSPSYQPFSFLTSLRDISNLIHGVVVLACVQAHELVLDTRQDVKSILTIYYHSYRYIKLGRPGSHVYTVLVFSLRLIHAILAQSRAGLEARINTDEPVIRDLPQTHSKE